MPANFQAHGGEVAQPPAVPRPSAPPGLRPYYAAPESKREEALAALAVSAAGFFADAVRTVTIRHQWQKMREQTEAAHAPGSRERCVAMSAARRAMVAEHGIDWNAPGRRLLLPAPAGSGKSAIATAEIARHGASLGMVHILTDTTANAEALAASIPGAVLMCGRSQPDPHGPAGARMCQRHEAAEAVARAGLSVSRALCRDAAGRTCPVFTSCGYQREVLRMRSSPANVFVGSHQYMVAQGPMPAADVVVVDESAISTLVGSVEFNADRLLAATTSRWRVTGLNAATEFHRIMTEVRSALHDPAGILDHLRRRGISKADDLAPAVTYLREAETRGCANGFGPDTPDEAVLDHLNHHPHTDLAAMLMMLVALQAEIGLPRDHAHGVQFLADKPVRVNGRQERHDRVAVYFRKRLVFEVDRPVLVLDASGDPEVYRRLLGNRLEVAAAVRCERCAEVVQVVDTTNPKSSLLGIGRRGKPLSPTSMAKAKRRRTEIAEVASVLAARHGPSMLLATNLPVEAALAPSLTPQIRVGHFGALRGSNAWKDCTAGLILGREQPPASAMEAIARAVWSDDPVLLHLPGAYNKAMRGIRMRNGAAIPVVVDVHPDQRVQRVLELHRERESEQAADRLRLIHASAPKHLYIACAVPLDMTVDRVVTWRELVHEVTGRLDNGCEGTGRRIYTNRLVEAWRCAGQVLPLSRDELMRLFGPKGRLFPKLWGSERALRDDLKKLADSAIKNLFAESASYPPIRVRYRLAGQRGHASIALVANAMQGRAALAALHGRPLTTFEVLDSILPSPPSEALPPPTPPKPAEAKCWTALRPVGNPARLATSLVLCRQLQELTANLASANVILRPTSLHRFASILHLPPLTGPEAQLIFKLGSSLVLQADSVTVARAYMTIMAKAPSSVRPATLQPW